MAFFQIEISDVQFSNSNHTELCTPSLGSCVGISIFDKAVNKGGIYIYLLPDSNAVSFYDAEQHLYMFANTGIPAFLEQAKSNGLDPSRSKIVAVGGGQIFGNINEINIGERNSEAVEHILKSQGLSIFHKKLGGIYNRSLSLDASTGESTILTFGDQMERV